MSRPARARGLKQPQGILPAPEYPVAPPAGAWIETHVRLQFCVYKIVAPPTGAWIVKPNMTNGRGTGAAVAPRAGAWIET